MTKKTWLNKHGLIIEYKIIEIKKKNLNSAVNFWIG